MNIKDFSTGELEVLLNLRDAVLGNIVLGERAYDSNVFFLIILKNGAGGIGATNKMEKN